jgi:GT2 family glycosyltransferase
MNSDGQMAGELRLGISIVCYKSNAALLGRTLASLQQAIAKACSELPLEVRLTLIDNGADAEQLQAMLQRSDLFPCSQLIANAHNCGFGAANNQAILRAPTTFHLVLNPDVELECNALLHGIRYLQQHTHVVAISPACTNGVGNIEHLCKRYPTLFDLLLRGFAPQIVHRIFDRRLAHYEYRELAEQPVPAPVDLISGCFMLCRTRALQQVGGFDERYFLYFEDFALSLALRQLGELHHLPECRITHHGGGAARKGWHHIRLFASSAARFFNSNGWRWC